MKSKRQIYTGMKILSGDDWVENYAVIVEEGCIQAVLPADKIKNHMPATVNEFPADYYLAPGFIDLHIHGAAGADVMDGTVDSIATIAGTLAKEGVTGFLATTMTAPLDQIEAALGAVLQVSKEPANAGAAILGVHLEGPFISARKAGAQMAEYICKPDLANVLQWQKKYEKIIKLVTLAPEVVGASEMIEGLKKENILVSVGHTDATYDETQTALAAGCTQATHLFNAMRGLLQREPGAVGALLLAPNVAVELIADGVHLHPAILSLVYQLKPRGHILLVTDAMRAKCLGEGTYDLGGQSVTVKNNRAELADGTFAGSVLTMPEAIVNMSAMSGCTLAQAFNMASAYPAVRLGFGNKKGNISSGYDADLVILNTNMEVMQTIVAGTSVYKREAVASDL